MIIFNLAFTFMAGLETQFDHLRAIPTKEAQ